MSQHPVKFLLLVLLLSMGLLSACGSENSTASSDSGSAVKGETREGISDGTAESAGASGSDSTIDNTQR